MTARAVDLTVFRWAGSWGPFKVNIPCGECSLNRGVLTEAVIDAHPRRTPVTGNHVFGQETCPHCVRAKQYLDAAGPDYAYHDVVKDPRALYEMLARVKPIVGPKTPVTVPQIWIDGGYVGGADRLSEMLHRNIEPNPERGQCSLSPGLGVALG